MDSRNIYGKAALAHFWIWLYADATTPFAECPLIHPTPEIEILLSDLIDEGVGRRRLRLPGGSLLDVANRRRTSPRHTRAQRTYGLRF